ncbi:MAG: hypothetical protein ACFFCQ_08895 [Promethearchaeota archaeon]
MTKKILVDFTETEEILLAPDNEKKKQDVSGVLTIENPAENEDLWSTELRISTSEGSTFGAGLYDVGEIAKQSKWTRNYEITDPATILTLTEVIDTDYVTGEENNFQRHCLICKQPSTILFHITLTNNFSTPVKNIRVRKYLPEIAELPCSFVEPHEGVTSIEGREVLWRLPSLDPEQEVHLGILASCTPETSKEIPAGKVEVNYDIIGTNQILITPVLQAETYVSPEVQPKEVEPNVWEVQTKFSGNPELKIRLEDFIVRTNEGQVIYQSDPDEELAGGEVWTDHFRIESENHPNLQKEVNYRPLWEITRNIHSHMLKEEWTLPVLEIAVSKILSPDRILSYERSDIEVKSVIENIGTGMIDKVTLKEDIPQYCYLIKDINVVVGDKEILDDKRIHDTPEVDETEKLEELKQTRQLVSSISLQPDGVKPGQKIEMTYILHAAKPKPNLPYPTRFKASAWPAPATQQPVTAKAIWEGNEEPGLTVEFASRSWNLSEDVKKGSEPGEFVNTITLANTGEVTIENIQILQELPTDFQFIEYVPKTVMCEEKEKEVLWTIPRLPRTEAVRISYTVKTETAKVFRKTNPTILFGD